jgi:hypothetical protein
MRRFANLGYFVAMYVWLRSRRGGTYARRYCAVTAWRWRDQWDPRRLHGAVTETVEKLHAAVEELDVPVAARHLRAVR